MKIHTTIIPAYRPSTATEGKYHVVSYNLDAVDPAMCGEDQTLASYASEHATIKAKRLAEEAERAAAAKAIAEAAQA